jgi:hypothetical protein
MKDRWPQALIMISGLLLIVLGLLATGAQLGVELLGPPTSSQQVQQSQQIIVSPNQLDASTRFVGLELVLVGALLEIVGYVGTRPWKDDPPQSK